MLTLAYWIFLALSRSRSLDLIFMTTYLKMRIAPLTYYQTSEEGNQDEDSEGVQLNKTHSGGH